ncbi:MAG: tyrosine-type recombinase/integrase [Anaerolineales bacterium]|nr:tyrosine-type recombinase/integrase [Anaerolineales bacterium]
MDNSIHRFLQHLQSEERAAENTLLAYSTDLEQFQRVVKTQSNNDDLIAALTEGSIRDYAAWLNQQGYRPATVSRKMAAVRSFLSYLGASTAIPTRRLQKLLNAPPSRQEKPLTLSRRELNSLIAAPLEGSTPGALRDAAILNLLYETAFRAHEIVRLQLSDLGPEGRTISRPGFSDERLQLERSSEILKEYLQNGRPHFVKHAGETRLFLNQRGKGLSRQGLWLVVKRWAEAAGLNSDLSPQTLRHTRAEHLLGEGIKRSEVQRLLGLSSPNALRIHKTLDERDEN